MELNTIENIDCMDYLAKIPDSYVDLVVIDPPYELETKGGKSNLTRRYHEEVKTLSNGISNNVLDEICRVQKR